MELIKGQLSILHPTEQNLTASISTRLHTMHVNLLAQRLVPSTEHTTVGLWFRKTTLEPLITYCCIPVISINPTRSSTRTTSRNDAFRTCIIYSIVYCVQGAS